MSDLEKYSNIYADLSQGAYKGRPHSKMLAQPDDNQLIELKNKGYATYNFGDGTKPVYLQPDNELRTVEEKKLFRTTSYEKGLLTDEKAGFNAYYVTDTSTLNKETKSTYFVTRGSDGASLDTLNDWLGNNYQFAINKAYIPQAKLATEAMY